MMGESLFKVAFLAFLGTLLWGLINEWSIEGALLRSTIAAIAVYFMFIVYFSFVRLILKSGVQPKVKARVQTKA